MIDPRPRSAFKFTQDEYDLYQSGVEIWRDIEGWEDLYRISTFGNVKSMERITYGKNKSTRVIKSYTLKGELSNAGYFRVTLSDGNRRKRITIHRFICITFLQNPNNYPISNHKSGIKICNRLDNLEFCTISMNLIHAFKMGLKKPQLTGLGKFGKLNVCSKAVNQYTEQGIFINQYESASIASRETGCCLSTICSCAKGNRKTSGGFIWKYQCDLIPLP